MGFGSVDILNLFPSVDGKRDEKVDAENLLFISDSAKAADVVLFAVGAGFKTSLMIEAKQQEVLNVLNPYVKKLHCIRDSEGKGFYHPLCPKVSEWNLSKLNVSELKKKCIKDD